MAGEMAAWQAGVDVARPDAALYGEEALQRQRGDIESRQIGEQHGATLEQMAEKHGYNLETMDVQQRDRLQELATVHDNNLETLERTFNYDTSRLNQQQKNSLEALTLNHGFSMEQIQEQLGFNREALQANLSADERQMMTTSFGSMFNDFLNNTGRIMADPDLPADAKRTSVDELYSYFTDWVDTLSDLNGYRVDWEDLVPGTEPTLFQDTEDPGPIYT
jgi:hypothetical protein